MKCKKIPYKTSTQAWGAVISAHRAGIWLRDVYKCQNCGQYHTTSHRDNYEAMPLWVQQACRKNRKLRQVELAAKARRKNMLPIKQQRELLASLQVKSSRMNVPIKILVAVMLLAITLIILEWSGGADKLINSL